jgi:hypothetical protein
LHKLLVVGRAADALDGDAGIVECLLLKGGLDLLNRALLDRLGDGVQVLKKDNLALWKLDIASTFNVLGFVC